MLKEEEDPFTTGVLAHLMQDGHFLLPLLLPGYLLDTACFFGLALRHLLAALGAVAESRVGWCGWGCGCSCNCGWSRGWV